MQPPQIVVAGDPAAHLEAASRGAHHSSCPVLFARACETPGDVMPTIDSADNRSSTPDRAERPLVAALGDINRHDDGVGPAVLQHLAGRGLDVTLVSCDAETTASADFWRDRGLAILVEPVCVEPCHPGRVHRMVMPRPGAGQLLVFAVETADVGTGPGMSPAVAAATRRVADAIAAELTAATAPAPVPLRRHWSRTSHRQVQVPVP